MLAPRCLSSSDLPSRLSSRNLVYCVLSSGCSYVSDSSAHVLDIYFRRKNVIFSFACFDLTQPPLCYLPTLVATCNSVFSRQNMRPNIYQQFLGVGWGVKFFFFYCPVHQLPVL